MRVLLVEDSDSEALALQKLLEATQWSVHRVSTLREAIDAVRERPVEMILLDLGLPDSDAPTTLVRLREATRAIPIVVLTGLADDDAAISAVSAGAQDFLVKGAVDGATLMRALRHARERWDAEERVRASEERFRALVENSADGVTLLDVTGTVLYASPAVTRVLGWEATEIESRSVFDLVHEEEREEARQSFKEVLLGQMRQQLTHRRYLCKDGGTRLLEITRSNRLDDPAVGAIVANFRDVTDRHRADAALDALRRQYELILSSIAEGVHGVGLDGRILFANPAVERILGWEIHELIGKHAHATMHHSTREGESAPMEQCAIFRTLRDGVVRHGESDVFWRRDGSLLLVDYTVAPMRDQEQKIVGAVVTFRDVTRQKHLEEQVEQAQRVTSLGRVAASVAHEFNNVLMAVQPFAEVIRRHAEGNDTIMRPVEKIFGAVKQGQRLTSQILRFTNPAEPALDRVDLARWMTELGDEVTGLLYGRTLAFDVRQPLFARADVMQLQQVMTNMILNARDASSPESTVTIGVTRAEDVPFLAQRLPSARTFVSLFVRDEGSGIPPDVIEHIFEPLFTTKRRGGTGLGLAVAHQIVARHGGRILVDTIAGEGTTFHIVLPGA